MLLFAQITGPFYEALSASVSRRHANAWSFLFLFFQGGIISLFGLTDCHISTEWILSVKRISENVGHLGLCEQVFVWVCGWRRERQRAMKRTTKTFTFSHPRSLRQQVESSVIIMHGRDHIRCIQRILSNAGNHFVSQLFAWTTNILCTHLVYLALLVRIFVILYNEKGCFLIWYGRFCIFVLQLQFR